MDRTQTKRRGRPPLPKEEVLTERMEIRLTADQRAKVERLGGPPWVRGRIDKAKEPDPK